jgi:hypothetical protein
VLSIAIENFRLLVIVFSDKNCSGLLMLKVEFALSVKEIKYLKAPSCPNNTDGSNKSKIIFFIQ